MGGVGPRVAEHQHFSHLMILPSQLAPFIISMNFLELDASSKRTNAVESTGTKNEKLGSIFVIALFGAYLDPLELWNDCINGGIKRFRTPESIPTRTEW